jgi:uncharacterized membrane protein HdeD (DUF308 family)
MTYTEILLTVAMVQGAFFYGACVIILFQVVILDRATFKQNRWRVTVLIGIMLVMFATLLTFYRSPYPSMDIWYVATGIGYFLVDFGLIKVFRQYLMDKKTKEFLEKQNKP